MAGASSAREEYLPAIIVLYDTLNDDDDEVREAGSAAAKSVLGQNLVPLEASNRLLQWLIQHFSTSAALKAITTSRIAGYRHDQAWSSPGAQLDAALRSDDSLFAVEEQNLFIDEVREANRWATAFQNLKWDEGKSEDGEILRKLEEWLLDGLAQMQQLLEQEDGPLGWASNPSVFAICTSIVRGSVVLSETHGSPRLRQTMAQFKELLKSPNHYHVSKLLMEPLGEL